MSKEKKAPPVIWLQDEIIERLRRELTAERDAVAQYIGERNE